MADMNPRYNIKDDISKNWYKSYPYTFEWKISDTKSKYFNLPIAPQNIQITTHFATNVIPTMYATIEEHSEQRYFDIVISGTTGMTPSYYKEYDEELNYKDAKGQGRIGFTVDSSLFKRNNAFNSFFRKTRELLNKAKNEAADVFTSVNAPIKSGIIDDQTGYVAFHNFYLFLLQYKDSVSSGMKPNKGHPLSFINYKDNNRYNVSITNFSLVRDFRNPMLYNYTISMKAYNLQSANSKDVGVQVNLENFGLNGIATSAFAGAANRVRKAKNAAYAAIAAIKSAGL